MTTPNINTSAGVRRRRRHPLDDRVPGLLFLDLAGNLARHLLHPRLLEDAPRATGAAEEHVPRGVGVEVKKPLCGERAEQRHANRRGRRRWERLNARLAP